LGNTALKGYLSGLKFTSTIIYAIAYSKPLLVEKELLDSWTIAMRKISSNKKNSNQIIEALNLCWIGYD